MPSKRVVRICLVVFAVGSAVIHIDSHARGGRWAARGLGAAAGAAGSGPALSQAELRQCIGIQNTLDALEPKLKESRAQIEAEKQKIEQNGEAIKATRASLDTTSQKAVDKFNAGVKRQQKRVAEHKAAVESHNKMADGYNEKVGAFKSTCAGKSYRESDMKAILAEAPTK